jgi:hypothetical protein
VKPARRRRLPAPVEATARLVEAGDGVSAEAFTGRAAEVIADRDRVIEVLSPLATTGKKVHDAHLNRQSQKDRAEFLRLGGELRKRFPQLGVNALLAHTELTDLVERYPERAAVWARDLYPKRPRGRPSKK